MRRTFAIVFFVGLIALAVLLATRLGQPKPPARPIIPAPLPPSGVSAPPRQ